MKSTEYFIEEMKKPDIPSVSDMESDFFSDASGNNALLSLFDMGAVGVCAYCGKDMCGFAYAADCVGDAELLRILVKDEYRKCGMGRSLLRALHKILKDNGVCHVFLEVRESNLAAISLYISEGYIRTGRRKGFYKKPCEDALLFTKEL